MKNLKDAGKSSWSEAEKGLDKIADMLGRYSLAKDISPDDVLGVLRPIYERGKRAMADHVRGYIRSAYSWGIKSEHDYRNTSPRRFKLVNNPAGGIPTEPKVVGTRWLDEAEFVQLFQWLECPDSPVHPLPPVLFAFDADRSTGRGNRRPPCRPVGRQRTHDWSKTKNGKPHGPIPQLAAELIGDCTERWFFPSAKTIRSRSAPVRCTASCSATRPQCYSVVTNRISGEREALAGKAGVSKNSRPSPNHTLRTLAQSYDRWNYMPEKRAGRKWDKFVTALLAKRPVTIAR